MLQDLKSKDSGLADPNEVNALKRRIAKLESDLKDKTNLANSISSELDQLKTDCEELRRRASVN
jgi:chromosome segregation ATPase